MPDVVLDAPLAVRFANPDNEILARGRNWRRVAALAGAVPGTDIDCRITTDVKDCAFHGMRELTLLWPPSEVPLCGVAPLELSTRREEKCIGCV